MVDVITKIKTAEESAEETRRTARREAAQLKEDAAQNGRNLLESEALRATKEYGAILEQAEKKASLHLEQSHSESAQACDQLKDTAKSKMDSAAKFIVERIVDSL